MDNRWSVLSHDIRYGRLDKGNCAECGLPILKHANYCLETQKHIDTGEVRLRTLHEQCPGKE